jgi:hypothetical protein
VRVLLDECVDWRLARALAGHEIRTVRQMGWTGLSNGELMALASRRFDAFVTVDRNLAFQQETTSLGLATVVLQARTNRLAGSAAARTEAPGHTRIGQDRRRCLRP